MEAIPFSDYITSNISITIYLSLYIKNGNSYTIKLKEQGLKLKPGQLAENITTQGIDLPSLEVGIRLALGDEVLLEVTQIGKVCHQPCAVYYQVGDCVMPREGIFAKVLKGSTLKVGNRVGVDQEQVNRHQ